MSQLSLFPTHEPQPTGCSLFLAVFPGEQAARDIYELGVKLRHKHSLSGSVRPPDHLHISLPCLNNMSGELNQVIQLTERACKEIANATPPFGVTHDRVLSFRGRPLN